jgi:AAA domain-containing protein
MTEQAYPPLLSTEDLAALTAEAEASDGPFTNTWADARDDERPVILQRAAATRQNGAEQEAEMSRPLTDSEAATVAEIRSVPLMDRLGAALLSEISADPPPPLLIDRLDPAGHTILYGTGGAGKGVIAAWWIVQLVGLGHRPLILDYERHPDEWSRRVGSLGGPESRSRVLHVAPLSAAWQARRGALWAQAEAIRELALSWAATCIVIDSIVPACGAADPLKPEAASQYAGALEYIGLPALSIAHVTKADSVAYPFGSVFWHNLARVSWSIERDGDSAILTARKANNYARPGKYAVTTTWRSDVPAEVWERPYSAQLADRIADVIVDSPMTVPQIVGALNEGDDEGVRVKADSVRAALRRGAKRFVDDGERWRLT